MTFAGLKLLKNYFQFLYFLKWWCSTYLRRLSNDIFPDISKFYFCPINFFALFLPSPPHQLPLSLSLTHFITTLCLHLLVMFVIVIIVFFRSILSLWEGWNKIIALSFMNMVKLFLVSLFFHLVRTLATYFFLFLFVYIFNLLLFFLSSVLNVSLCT